LKLRWQIQYPSMVRKVTAGSAGLVVVFQLPKASLAPAADAQYHRALLCGRPASHTAHGLLVDAQSVDRIIYSSSIAVTWNGKPATSAFLTQAA
jgi:hypothetical protein